jgi:hypothetical protein
MSVHQGKLSHRARAWLDRSGCEVFRDMLLISVATVALVLTVGRPLGDLKRGPLTSVSLFRALCSPEILCTAVSFLLLLASALVLRHVYRLRRQQALAPGRTGPSLLWLLMCIGFFYLAVDEIAFVHEGIDKLIHLVFSIEQTAVTDRLDDLIPAAYGLIGLVVLWCYRAELSSFRGFWPWLVAGMFLLFASVGLDVLTHRKDILMAWIADRELAGYCWNKLNALEEVCKVVAELLFFGMFLGCRDTARRWNQAEPGRADASHPSTKASSGQKTAA